MIPPPAPEGDTLPTPPPRPHLPLSAPALRDRLTRCSARADGLRQNVPKVIARLDRLRHELDGMPVGTDAPKVTQSSESTSVERTVEHRLDVDERRLRFERHITLAEEQLGLAVKMMWSLIGEKLSDADRKRLRCAGTGDSVGAKCWQVADPSRRDGRCVDCGRSVDSNERRARRHAELTSRAACTRR